MRRLELSIGFLFLLTIFPSCTNSPEKTSDVLSGDYWKIQALTDIMPFWTEYARDKKSGAFFTNLDSLWLPFGSQDKYPSMVSRHLFSYSVAYLLSGDEDNLKIADNTLKWLLENAWDKEYGGWFDALDAGGKPVQTTKTTFVQVYTITGLTLYYFVTHDTTVLRYIEKSNELLESKVWDSISGGYFNMMNRDWSIADSNKSFSSQLTPVSGYLIYLYQATREKKYLDQISRILDTTMNNMVDNESGWILENFDRNWKYLKGKDDETEINIGHNIEAATMLLRDYLITGSPDHLKSAKTLAWKINKNGVLNDKEVWLTTVSRTSSARHGTDTYWWVQAYGNIFNLYLHHVLGKSQYLDDFQKGAGFWDSSFIDKKNGDTYFSVDTAGRPNDRTKATRFKTSYHSIEHCLLNMLCLDLWINNVPVEFHFKISYSREGDLLYPSILEDENIKISKVVIDNLDQQDLLQKKQNIRLPDLNNSKVVVTLEISKNSK
jgi:cellobiose epimerase